MVGPLGSIRAAPLALKEIAKLYPRHCDPLARNDGRTFNCHRPRRRAIQYSRDASDESRGRGVLDRPVKPDDDS
jgi:hypothetical protein